MDNEIKSYAQNFEDVILWRALKDIEKGFYIDVGAHDPVSGSVTKLFYDKGWSGINIEPVDCVYLRLSEQRERDTNIRACAGSYDGEVVLYDVKPSGLATLDREIAQEYKEKGNDVNEVVVPVFRLDSLMHQPDQEVHFLKVDVEGAEKDVLLGISFDVLRPWIVVVESTYPNSTTPSHKGWESILVGAGYCFVYFDGLNRFYVAKERMYLAERLNTPPNYFDHFSLDESSFFCRDIASELKNLRVERENLSCEKDKLQLRILSELAKSGEKENIIENLKREHEAFRDELAGIYLSRAWRIVKIAHAFKTKLYALSRLKYIPFAFVRNLLRTRLGYKFAAQLRRASPGAYGRLHRWYHRRIAGGGPGQSMSVPSLDSLNKREAEIFFSLKDALHRQRGSR